MSNPLAAGSLTGSRALVTGSSRGIGADTVGLLVPGGSIAVKVAKLAIDQGNKPS